MAATAGEAPLVLTTGDPAGIGPDIALTAWRDREQTTLPPFVLAGDPALLRKRARLLNLDIAIREIEEGELGAEGFAASFRQALLVLPCGDAAAARPGIPDPANAPATLASLDTGIRLASAGLAAALVTNPIAKHVLQAAGFTHPGHTEYLAACCARPGEAPPLSVMMLWSPELAVVPVTIHVALRRVPELLTSELIVRTGRIVAEGLARRFGIAKPRLALAGLNPHAGEEGRMGSEDAAVVRPAVEELRRLGIDASGPYPADTMFHAAARRRYDAALCMYHDQALIPLKTIAFDDGVNVTLGLPFVRTSPDHGTAFDIAGSGKARPDSLVAALKLARRMADTGRQ